MTDYTARDAGVERNLSAADGGLYKDFAIVAIDQLIEMGRPFSADQVRMMIPQEFRGTPVHPHHHNVLPSLFSRYAREGLIVRVGEVRSARSARHGSPNKLWIAAGKGGPRDHQAELSKVRNQLEKAMNDTGLLSDVLLRIDSALNHHEAQGSTCSCSLLGDLREVLPKS